MSHRCPCGESNVQWFGSPDDEWLCLCKACANFAWRDQHKLEPLPDLYRRGQRYDNDTWKDFLHEVKVAHRIAARFTEKEQAANAKAKARAKADSDSDMEI